jgi:hypothetical protein
MYILGMHLSIPKSDTRTEVSASRRCQLVVRAEPSVVVDPPLLSGEGSIVRHLTDGFEMRGGLDPPLGFLATERNYAAVSGWPSTSACRAKPQVATVGPALACKRFGEVLMGVGTAEFGRRFVRGRCW